MFLLNVSPSSSSSLSFCISLDIKLVSPVAPAGRQPRRWSQTALAFQSSVWAPPKS